jgi:gamma-glutamyltranspeptidase/glutathione hydrolase/leukotriene-C4 hydrolase
VDAAVATALCQGVMNPMASGMGGGGFIIIRTAKGDTEVIDAREVAPAAATEGMFHGAPLSASTVLMRLRKPSFSTKLILYSYWLSI